MQRSFVATSPSLEVCAASFFQESVGQWRSERRYCTLRSGVVQEVVSFLTVEFLPPECQDLGQLARLHQLEGDRLFTCGAKVAWESHYPGPQGKTTNGHTMFGLKGDKLYRDRGFATSRPIVAQCWFSSPHAMVLRTEYGGSVFEEECKLIGHQYRTRQTIISRAGEEQTIGQYLERRIA